MMQIPVDFDVYFQEVYGDRWPQIRRKLLDPEPLWARANAFAGLQFQPGQKPEAGPLRRSNQGLLEAYIMDPASIAAARALRVQPGDRVLDMCAAPGGKSLILAEGLPAELILNEVSSARRERLKKVVQQYIPREKREGLSLSGRDGGLFARSHAGYFDRILVDAPCSGERHLLQHPTELQEWSRKRSARLAQRQYALLTAALIATRVGGEIVYSTCALSPLENEEVIRELLRRKGDRFEVVSHSETEDRFRDLQLAPEARDWGFQFCPDRGAGPLYFALLRVTQNQAIQSDS